MHRHAHALAMEQRIFKLGLSTETISVYLLCCGLAEEGTPITSATLGSVWNGTPAALGGSLAELKQRNILDEILADGGARKVYRLKEARRWREP
jgi:hypothetical protein